MASWGWPNRSDTTFISTPAAKLVTGRHACVLLVPLPPAVGRAVDQAVNSRTTGAILLNTRGTRMDRHAATRRLRRLATTAVARLPRMHPHMRRHTLVISLDAGVDLRDRTLGILLPLDGV